MGERNGPAAGVSAQTDTHQVRRDGGQPLPRSVKGKEPLDSGAITSEYDAQARAAG
jgi:hypothetical protein